MPTSPEEVKKYNDMLDTLIEEYPELEEEASALGSAIADIDMGEEEFGDEDMVIAPDMEEGLEDEEDIMMLEDDEDEDEEDILL